MAVKYVVVEKGNPGFRPGIDLKEMQKTLRYEKM